MFNIKFAGGDRQISSTALEAQNTPIIPSSRSKLKVFFIDVHNQGAVDAYLLMFDRAAALTGGETSFVGAPVKIPADATGGKSFLPARPFATGLVAALSTSKTQFTSAGAVGRFDINCEG